MFAEDTLEVLCAIEEMASAAAAVIAVVRDATELSKLSEGFLSNPLRLVRERHIFSHLANAPRRGAQVLEPGLAAEAQEMDLDWSRSVSPALAMRRIISLARKVSEAHASGKLDAAGLDEKVSRVVILVIEGFRKRDELFRRDT